MTEGICHPPVKISPDLLLVRAQVKQTITLNLAVLINHPLLVQPLGAHHAEVVGRLPVMHEV